MMNVNEKASSNKTPTYRWVVYGLLALCYFLANFHRLATGVMKDELVGAFNLSAAAFGNMGSMVFYAYMVMQVPTGILVDTVGPRKTVTVGCLVTAVGSLMFAMARTNCFADVSRLVVGLGISVSYLSVLKVQARWFRAREFATITGITFLIGNMGSLLAQTPLRALVETFSWRGTFIVFAGISVVMAVLVYAFVRNSPEDMGLEPLEPAAANPVPDTGGKEQIKNDSILRSLLSVTTNFYNWPSFLVAALLCVTVTSLTGSFGSVYIRDTYGVSMMEASHYTLLLTLGIAIGAAVIGTVSDLIKRRKIIIVLFSGISAAVWLYIVFICGGKPPLSAIGVLYFISGISLTAYTLPYTVVKESNDPRFSGLSTSLVGLIGFFGSAIGPVAVGRIIDYNSPALSGGELYAKAFTLLALCNLASFICSLFIKETFGENLFLKSR